ncbi:MAG TPA: amino acid adenylation domain-containing protein, partial [Thermoanaerobaculia bacterium]|nr:amino acid adenylation domain-containing protein [Thermoanaerobaculia bacterium]
PGGEPGARAYRTGDLARWLPDGEIEYLGRIDGQVKVRGVRVEIGEIEAVLCRHPAVAQAAVALRGGGRWLAGFWVAKAGAVASSEELSAYLAARLPEAMVPAILVELPALPALPNGKVDRGALPEPTFTGTAEVVAPRTPTEQILAAIWAEVLGRPEDPIGVGDDFFALGGHSLLATRVVARVRGALGVDLPVRALFEHPTLAALARVVDARRAASDAAVAPPLSPAARGGATSGLPVSFAQQRLWFLHQLEPESPAYHLPLALRLAGPLDGAALAAALVEIARRHEALRTRFPAEDGEPTQEIVPIEIYAARSLPLIDLGALPPAPRMAEARRRAAAEAVLPFDLAAGPVSRTALLRLGDEEHVGLLTQHHIVSDAWSRGILLRELSALYAAARERRPSPLPPLPIQYADFALWQREWLRGEVLERQIDYWRRRLEGIPHALDLPADRPRPPQQSFRGATRAVRLAPELSRDLRAFARRESATPYMAGLALFQALLCRWTGRDEVLVGSPVANRERLEVEGLIGFFANTLALRGGSSADLRAALAAARESVLEATANQDLPFEKLVEELKPLRDPSRSPLVQVLYTLQPPTPLPLALPGLVASPLGGASGRTAQFDLSLSLVDAPAGIGGGLEFSTALFDPASAARMAGQIEAFFAAAVADLGADLGALSLLSASERHQLAIEWNDGEPAPSPPLIQGFLARHARERPDDPALESVHEPDRRYSWSEVAVRADLLARRLAALGAGPERTVGVSLEWSVDRALAILGIWQAGACYLPVDPELPVERRALLLADAGAIALITREAFWADLPPGLLTAPLLLDRENGLPERVGPEAAPRAALPENLAYLIYTSGSTGVPKGVAVSHGQAAEHFAAAASFYRLGPADRVAQFAAASFDVSMEQVGVALASGGTLVVRGPDLPPPLELSAWLTRHRITDADLPTAVWTEWSRSDEPLPAGLRVLLTGGEAMPPEAAKRFRARLAVMAAPPVVLNGYGPTEAVVTATCYDVRFGRLPDSGAVSIGRPLPGRFAAVVDPAGWLQALGGIGELVLGGPLARGYLDRPELTAERFRPDAFGEKWGARVYRTGDRVRQRGDGTFDFLGRTDQQIKVRGFRIEPGEIEAVLAKHPAIKDAIVLAREVPGAGPRLIAWFRASEQGLERTGADIVVADLRSFLAARLPEYMVPAAFVEVAEWPIGATGKIDHRALPEPQLDRTTRAFAPPRDAVEEVLAGVWAEVLNLERVGVDEDFFDLGGHSLLATRVVSRIHKVFRMDLPLRDFFGGTTIESLARIVREKEARPGRAEKIARLYLSIERLPDEGVRDQLAARREQGEAVAGADLEGRSE